MRHEMIFLPSILLLLSSLNVARVAQQDQVEPMEKTPVFRANVVSRTTKADRQESISAVRSLCRKQQARRRWKARRGGSKSTRN